MACADAADPEHEASRAARDHWLEAEGPLITSDYVINETLTLLRVRLGLTAAEEWWHGMAASRRVVRELIHEERAERARHIFFVIATRIFHSQNAPALR